MRSARELVLRSASLALFGKSYAQLWQQLGLENGEELVKLYLAHASSVRGDDTDKGAKKAFALKLPQLGKKDATAALAEALAPWAREQGLSPSEAVEELTWSVEQTAALLCNMLALAQVEPAASSQLGSEQAAVLKGANPKATITSSVLSELPMLDAFQAEVSTCLVGLGRAHARFVHLKWEGTERSSESVNPSWRPLLAEVALTP